MKPGLILVLLLTILGCAEEEPYHFSGDQIERLLTQNSEKYWLIAGKWENGSEVALENCNKYKMLRLGVNTSKESFYEILIDSGRTDCPEAGNDFIRLDSGGWELMAAPSHNNTPDTLSFENDDAVSGKVIMEITSLFLTLQETRPDTVVQNGDSVVLEKVTTERFTAHY